MDTNRLATKLREAFPDAPILPPLKVLGEGFGNLVVETDNRIVFRIAKHAQARAGHRRERRVLPVVQTHVSGLRVPRVRYDLAASAGFPFGVVGYDKLPGRPLSPNDIDHENRDHVAGQIADVLVAVHGIDVDALAEIGLPAFPPSRARLMELWHNVSPFLTRHLGRSQHRQVQRWLERLFDYTQRYPYSPALVHGDFWYEKLLFDDEQRRLVGVLDFENAAIGDPTIDLATQRSMGDRFARAVVDAYHRHRAPSDLAGRIDDLLGLRELLGLEQGLVTENVDADALGKVTAAILRPPR